MVSSSKEVQTAQQEVISPTKSQQQAQQRAAALATLAKKVGAEPKKPKQLNPSELVAQGLAAAAAAAANAAAPFASFGNAVPFKAVTSRMQNAAAAGQSTAVATIATVTAAVSSNFNKEHSKAPKETQAADPTQWFVCDDPVSHTRYFVIQGSETIDHWRVNLSFDPVVFEDKSLGVKVHSICQPSSHKSAGNMVHDTQVVSAVLCAGVCESPLRSLSVAPRKVQGNSCILCLHMLCVCSSRQLVLSNTETTLKHCHVWCRFTGECMWLLRYCTRGSSPWLRNSWHPVPLLK